jgi:hypothetical protein
LLEWKALISAKYQKQLDDADAEQTEKSSNIQILSNFFLHE